MRIADLVNEFAWSHSRAEMFDECPRRYWFRYYAHWGGWKDDATELQKAAYLLGKMTGLAALVGNIVHDTISAVVKAGGVQRYGKDPVQAARDCMNARWVASRDRRWEVVGPAKAPPLKEHLFGPAPTADELASYRKKLIDCMDTALRSDVLAQVTAGGPDAVKATEDRTKTSIGGVTAYAVPDLVVHVGDEVWIPDWKTGRVKPGHRAQLRLYALYARERWGMATASMRPFLVTLPDGGRIDEPVDDATLDTMVGEVQASAERILSLLDDREANVARKEAFVAATNPSACRFCNFTSICDEKPAGAG